MPDRLIPGRVVVTGLGVVTPIGSTIPQFWSSLLEGRSGAGVISRFDASQFPTGFAAEVHDVAEDRASGDPQLRSLLDRKNLFGWIAASDALHDAGLDAPDTRTRIGVAIGTERRAPDFLHRIATGSPYNHPADHLRCSTFVLASALAAAKGFTGPNMTVAAACASSAQALGIAYQKLQWGEADVMVAGGCDSLIDPLMLTAFSQIDALSKRNDDPSRASRPFDRRRDGLVLGEGAGMVVLERLEHAQARGAHLYGEILGYASSCNSYRAIESPPDGRGLSLAMQGALRAAKRIPEDVDYINAHATSTPEGDRSETAAIKRCFGAAAYGIAVSSTKSMTGHLFAASGAVGLIVCVLAVTHNAVPPTINQEVRDPACDLDYVPNVGRERNVRIALVSASGFGGVNAALLVGKWGHA